jgi:nonsense-mediated mRNA decay protein 3
MECIICGKGNPVLSGLCQDCIQERRRFIDVPEFSELLTCAHCGSVVIGKRWMEPRPLVEELAEAAKRATKVDSVEGADIVLGAKAKLLNDNNADAEVTATIMFGKKSITQTARTRVRIRRMVCDRCSKIHGKYFEAVLQVRASGRRLSDNELRDVAANVRDMASDKGKSTRAEFISKEEVVDGGLDFQLGTIYRAKAIARALATRFGGKITESSKLAGNKLGKELYRVTFLVRLPGLKQGDFARLGERVLLVTHVSSKGVSATDLVSGESLVLDDKEVEGTKRLGGPELVEEAVVLQARRPEVQVMDPASFCPVSIVAPDWYWKGKKTPESVRIVKVGEDVYLVPGSG